MKSYLFPSIALVFLLLSACDFAPLPPAEPTPNLLNVARVPTCAGEDPSLIVLPSLVEIYAETYDGAVSGSGFIVDSERGYILTVSHVLANVDRDSIWVTYRNGVTEQAVWIAHEPSADISLLRGISTGFPPLHVPSDIEEALAESGGGDIANRISELVAVGWVDVAYGETLSLTVDNAGWQNITIDTPGEPGMSGGPLVDPCGNLVGIVSLGTNGPGGTVTAIALDQAKLAELMSRGTLYLQPPTPVPPTPSAPALAEVVDSQEGFAFSWPEAWHDDTEFGKELIAEGSPLLVPNVIFYGGNPAVGRYSPNLMVVRLVVPRTTELGSLVDEEINQLGLGYPGLEIVGREKFYLAGIPAELITSTHDYDALQMFHLILLSENHEWFVQCAFNIGLVSEAEACRNALLSFRLIGTISPTANTTPSFSQQRGQAVDFLIQFNKAANDFDDVNTEIMEGIVAGDVAYATYITTYIRQLEGYLRQIGDLEPPTDLPEVRDIWSTEVGAWGDVLRSVQKARDAMVEGNQAGLVEAGEEMVRHSYTGAVASKGLQEIVLAKFNIPADEVGYRPPTRYSISEMDTEWEAVQTAMNAMMAKHALVGITPLAFPNLATNDWSSLPAGTGTEPLSRYLLFETTKYYYCFDSIGRITQEGIFPTKCPS